MAGTKKRKKRNTRNTRNKQERFAREMQYAHGFLAYQRQLDPAKALQAASAPAELSLSMLQEAEEMLPAGLDVETQMLVESAEAEPGRKTVEAFERSYDVGRGVSVFGLPAGDGWESFDEDAAFWDDLDDDVEAGLPDEIAFSPLFVSREVDEPEGEELERLRFRERTVRSVLANLLARVSDSSTLEAVQQILMTGADSAEQSQNAADDVRLWARQLERAGEVEPGSGFERLNSALADLYGLLTDRDREMLAKAGIEFGRLSPAQRHDHLMTLGLPVSGVLRADVRRAKAAALAAASSSKRRKRVEKAAAALLRQSDRDLFLDPEKQD